MKKVMPFLVFLVVMILSISGSAEKDIQLSGAFNYIGDFGYEYPIRYVEVRIYADDSLIATTETDENGEFSLTREFDACKNVHLKIYSENYAALVKDRLGRKYSIETENRRVCEDQAASWDLGKFVVSEETEPWEALDYVTNAHDFFKQQHNHPQLSIIYPTGDHVYFSTKPSGIGSIKLPLRELQYWKKTDIYHEFAHSIMYKLYYDNGVSFPRDCYITPHGLYTESCKEFAYTEGWAEFIEAAVENNPDAVQSGGNIETNIWWKGEDGLNEQGEIVEGAIASIFWDIFDTNRVDDSRDDDGISDKFSIVFEIIKKDNPNDILEFWQHWFSTTDKTPENFDSEYELAEIFYNNGIRREEICLDFDGDGYKAGFCEGLDCDDKNENINPDAEEICDKKDNDCDGKTDEGCPEIFVRGDANEDGKIDIADGIYILNYLFADYECNNIDAMDVNDDGKLDIADPIYLLSYLFQDADQPNPPFPESGVDPTEDELSC